MRPEHAAGSGHALFVDFDGTLVDIAERPDAVRVEPGLPELLTRLREKLGGALAIVTGRPLADVDRFLPGLQVDGCGLHGLERRIAGRTDRPNLPSLAGEIEGLRRELGGRPGLLVEDKGIGVAVHWRMAPHGEGAAKAAIDALAARLGPGYRLQDGKAVRELVPAAAGKGGGIRALAARPPYLGRRPVFAGDDRTDEDGFAAVNEKGGVSLKIGPGPTRAAYRIKTAAAFRRWLADWAERPDSLPPLAMA